MKVNRVTNFSISSLKLFIIAFPTLIFYSAFLLRVITILKNMLWQKAEVINL
jgi:hypothetical protein